MTTVSRPAELLMKSKPSSLDFISRIKPSFECGSCVISEIYFIKKKNLKATWKKDEEKVMAMEFWLKGVQV